MRDAHAGFWPDAFGTGIGARGKWQNFAGKVGNLVVSMLPAGVFPER